MTEKQEDYREEMRGMARRQREAIERREKGEDPVPPLVIPRARGNPLGCLAVLAVLAFLAGLLAWLRWR